VNRKELTQKLELVSRALADTNLIPIFQCFGFTGENVFAYNDALAIIAPDVKTKDAFAVDGNVLLGLLKNSYGDDVDFKPGAEALTVKTGKSVFNLPWFPKTDFLFVEPDEEPEVSLPIDPEFLDGLAACLLTSSRDETKRPFMGVLLNQQFEHITLYSTDGDAITSFITGHKSRDKKNYLLPNSFCDALVKAFKDTGSTDGILDVSDEWVKASLTSGYVIYGRLNLVDNPVDHDAEIKKTVNGKPKFVAVPEGLHEALSRARIIADPESAPTWVGVSKKHMSIETETSMGKVEDVIPSDGHTEVEATISAEMMQRCIGLCDEMVILENCAVFRRGEKLFILIANQGE
jgi:DNA polymerase III sliding clamp (beta) subunit (PCNA family)